MTDRAAGTEASTHGDAGPDPRRWRALAVCLVVGFMSLLDVSIVNVALPSIAVGLGAGDNALQWVVSGYALTFGLALVPAGRLGDARGRRTVFLVGLALFLVSSALCGLAPSAELLVVGRLLQGAAGGMVTPQVSGLVQQLFRGAERAKAFGLLGASIGLSTAVGPVLGGLLIAAAGPDPGWRLVFFVNLPIGVAALLLAVRLIPPDPPRHGRQDLDPVGVLLLGAALTCVLLALIEQQVWGRAALLLLPAGAAVAAAWVAWERRHARQGGVPVVDPDLFSRGGYVAGAGVAVLFFAGFTGVFFIYTQYLQRGLGYGALAAGLAVLPFALGSAVAAAVGGRLVPRHGRRLVLAGLVQVVLGFAATWLAAATVPGRGVVWAAAGPLLLAGFGSGLTITPNITVTLQDVPVRYAGVAGGVLQTGQRLGAAAGVAVTGAVFYAAVAASGDWAGAFRQGMLVVTGLTLLSLVAAAVDVRRASRPGSGTGRLGAC
jgi:EmrB/QacA subfamily drug resistance transporter